MKKRSEGEDIPKIVASIMVTLPSLAVNSGFAYLRMRRRAHNNSKTLMNSLIQEGIPEEYARRLSEEYATDISLKRIMKEFGVSFPPGAP